VLIVGYDVDTFENYYWMIQNSWGRKWAQRGFGLLHREHKRGRQSLFVQVYYGKKERISRQKEVKSFLEISCDEDVEFQ